MERYPLTPPPAGEYGCAGMLFEAGTVVLGMEIAGDGAFLKVAKPVDEVAGAPAEVTVHFCPPDPKDTDWFLAPSDAELGRRGRHLGKIVGPNGSHTVMLRVK